MTFEEIADLAQKVLDGKSNSYVQDAYILARVVLRDLKLAEAIKRDHDAMFENLSSTQTRCTELLEENRKLRSLLPATFSIIV